MDVKIYPTDCLQLPKATTRDHTGKMHLCSKYLETFTRAREKDTSFADLSIILLAYMREIIMLDQPVHAPSSSMPFLLGLF